MTSSHPYERLAELMDERRGDLGLSWREVASEADITPETLRAVRRGVNAPSTLTRRGIERALQWTHGSIDRVLDGGEPGIVVTGTATGNLGALRAEIRGTVTPRHALADLPVDDPVARLAAVSRLLEERAAEIARNAEDIERNAREGERIARERRRIAEEMRTLSEEAARLTREG